MSILKKDIHYGHTVRKKIFEWFKPINKHLFDQLWHVVYVLKDQCSVIARCSSAHEQKEQCVTMWSHKQTLLLVQRNKQSLLLQLVFLPQHSQYSQLFTFLHFQLCWQLTTAHPLKVDILVCGYSFSSSRSSCLCHCQPTIHMMRESNIMDAKFTKHIAQSLPQQLPAAAAVTVLAPSYLESRKLALVFLARGWTYRYCASGECLVQCIVVEMKCIVQLIAHFQDNCWSSCWFSSTTSASLFPYVGHIKIHSSSSIKSLVFVFCSCGFLPLVCFSSGIGAWFQPRRRLCQCTTTLTTMSLMINGALF